MHHGRIPGSLTPGVQGSYAAHLAPISLSPVALVGRASLAIADLRVRQHSTLLGKRERMATRDNPLGFRHETFVKDAAGPLFDHQVQFREWPSDAVKFIPLAESSTRHCFAAT